VALIGEGLHVITGIEMYKHYKVGYWNLLRNLRKGNWNKAISEVFLLLNWLWMDEIFFSLRFHKRVFGRWPKIFYPQRFRDHLLKIKLSKDGHRELRSRITDKELVKEYIRQKIGDGYTAKTYAVLHKKEEVRNFTYPENCAIKSTHDSGGIILRRAREPVDVARIERWFNRNYYWALREPNYRDLKPKIIIEELLTRPEDEALLDYKIFCFSGVPAFIQVDFDRFKNHTRIFFSPGWKKLNFRINFGLHQTNIKAPDGLAEMLSVARILSSEFSFMRVDFYQLDGRIIVGELTNFPAGTRTRFFPDEADFKAGLLFQNPNIDVEALFGVVDD
jgi:TupA-like ATPgrasp